MRKQITANEGIAVLRDVARGKLKANRWGDARIRLGAYGIVLEDGRSFEAFSNAKCRYVMYERGNARRYLPMDERVWSLFCTARQRALRAKEAA